MNTWRLQTPRGTFWYKGITIVLCITFILSDVSYLPFADFIGQPETQVAEAATGDFSIFRNAAATTEVTTTPLAVTWDTVEVESSNLALQGDNSSIDLTEGGKYLVLYNVWTEKGAGTGADRRSFQTSLRLNGIETAYGRAASYIRDQSADDTRAYAAGAAILNASAGQDLQVYIERDDTNTAQSHIRAGTNGISIVKLNDTFDYARLRTTTNSGDVSGNTNFTDVAFNTSDEVDVNSFNFTASSTASDITLKGPAGRKFLITTNVRLQNTGNGATRQNYETRLTLDGNEVPGTRTSAYIRGSQGTVSSVANYTGIIEKTSAADQILNLELRRESEAAATTVIVGDATAFSAVALPTAVNTVSLTTDDVDQTHTVAQSPLAWTAQTSLTESLFSHSTSTNNSRIEVDKSGNYLFFSTAYTSRTTSAVRAVPKIDWRLDGTNAVPYGGHGSFNRGDQGSQDAYTSGSSGGLLLRGLTAGQYLEVLQSDENGNSINTVFPTGRIAVQGIDLASLSAIDTTVAVFDAPATEISAATTNLLADSIAITEATAGRNVTSIEISEQGTIDAENDISNIRLFYDLDTSAPYTCESESYDGTESQYGATSTSGFNAANGSITFTDTISISPTQALCVYVVFDVAAAASDTTTINTYIANPNTDVVVTGGATVGPSIAVGADTVSTIIDPEITQAGYHWRNDDGNETDATSATGGSANTPALSFSSSTPQRLRTSIYAAGSGSSTMQFRLEYAEKVGTCEAATGWNDIGIGGGAWDLFDSANVANGADTTNIPVANGGIADPAPTFITPNGAFLDTSSQTGPLKISEGEERSIGEYGTKTVTNGTPTTVTLTNTYSNPVVTVSVRYSRSGDSQRSGRVVAKTNTSFDVLTDNYDSTVTGSTVIDYVVMEAGDWEIQNDDGVNMRVFATSTLVSNTSIQSRPMSGDPGGKVITYPTSFGATAPTVLSTVSSNNDPDWLLASVYDGTTMASPPTATQVGIFLNENFATNGHTEPEMVDVIAFAQGNGSYRGTEYQFKTTGSANVSDTPFTFTFSPSFTSSPEVTVVNQLTNNGSDGGYTMVDTDTPATVSGVTVAIDEDGPSADRGHTTEEVGVVSFLGSGLLYVDEIVNKNFAEIEFALQATASAVEGAAYCFRLTDAGTPLRNYTEYPEATLNADVAVSAMGNQVATTSAGSIDAYLGGTFVINDNVASRIVSSITLSESGTVNASTSLNNIRLFYEFDTTAPYTCESESYDGTEAQFGSTATNFDAPNGSASFTDSVTVSTTSALCIYPVLDVTTVATDGETINLEITNPSSEVVVSSGSVGPGSVISPNGSTTIQAAALEQAAYHWRLNDGDEAAASSATGGTANTALNNVQKKSIQRLRLAVTNVGNATSDPTQFRIEYGTKVSTCEAVGIWQEVGTGAAFVMASTSLLIEGNNTTDIAEGTGGVPNPNDDFLTSNGGQRDTTSETGTLSLTATDFVELEYAVQPTEQAGFSISYCFRVTDSGTALPQYSQYGELTIQEQQDFFTQRGTEQITGTSTTLMAGVDYTAPASAANAFIRVTNTHMTGAGGSAGAQDTPDDFTVYIENPANITNSITIARPSTANDDTNVSWEIIEYTGLTGGDNEMIVRDTGTITYGGSSLFATGTTVATVSDDSQVVVFITGQQNPDTGTVNYNTGLSISSWNASTNQPVFERGDADGVAARLSYAVVEYTGANWFVQRNEHTYAAAGVVETESITAVNSLARTFLHTQKLSGDELYNLDETGHEVWLSSIGAISYELEAGATNPSDQRSVAWVIENVQSGTGAMAVYRSNGTIAAGGGQPATFTFSIGATVNTTNASITANNQSTGAGNFQPRGFLGVTILNGTQYQLYRADDGQNQDFRVEVIDYPTAKLSFRQNYYRLYVPDDTVTPSDPHPPGLSDLGENAAMTDLTEPLGTGEAVHIRMSLFVNNATFAQNSKAFTLQYGRRVTTCDAITVWSNVGAPGSGVIWRGVDASPTDGVAIGDLDLLLSVSDVGGTYEETNDSSVNPNTVNPGEDVEYAWLVENNGALQRNSYCFRMVEAGGAELDGYENYPTVRSSGYTPVTTDWRWYDDIDNETPNSASAATNTAIAGVGIDDAFKLRVAAEEIEGASGSGIKFNLQFSEYADFRDGGTTLITSSSCTANSLWCYADGAADEDNDVISTPVLAGIDTCSGGVGDGCGLHNEAPGLSSPFTHQAFATTEHEFTLQQAGARVNAIYFFRLIDATNGVPVTASSSYPSLQVSTSTLSFSVAGLPSGTTTAGVTTDVTATNNSVSYEAIPIGQEYEAAQRLTVDTNATDGYQVFVYSDGPLTNGLGNDISAISSTNASPAAWSTACNNLDNGCFGYHTTDPDLSGNAARFAADDSYAALTTIPAEVVYSSLPVPSVEDVIYKVQINELQPAGMYNTFITYIVTPIF